MHQHSSPNAETKQEKVLFIPLTSIDDFPDHPFQVKNDAEMQKLIASIQQEGILTPFTVRQKENGRYELISGHRRKYACQSLNVEQVPVIVRDFSREEAVIAMVDSNLQRERILPSEKAYAYRMKMEAMKHQGQRADLTTCAPMEHKSVGEKSRDVIAAELGESREQVRRYIRLTHLSPELLEMVDREKIAFRPAVELSYLTEEEQWYLSETTESEEATPSLSQAIRMKRHSQKGTLDIDRIFHILTEQKANQVEKVKISMDKLEDYFPRGTPPKKVEEVILKVQKVQTEAEKGASIQKTKGEKGWGQMSISLNKH